MAQRSVTQGKPKGAYTLCKLIKLDIVNMSKVKLHPVQEFKEEKSTHTSPNQANPLDSNSRVVQPMRFIQRQRRCRSGDRDVRIGFELR